MKIIIHRRIIPASNLTTVKPPSTAGAVLPAGKSLGFGVKATGNTTPTVTAPSIVRQTGPKATKRFDIPDPKFICHVCKQSLAGVCADDFAVCYTPSNTRFYLHRPWHPKACETKWDDYWYKKRQKDPILRGSQSGT